MAKPDQAGRRGLSAIALLDLLKRGSYRVAVVVDPVRVSEAVRSQAAEQCWPLVTIGLPLAEELRDVRPDERGRNAQDFLYRVVGDAGPGPVALVEIDLL